MMTDLREGKLTFSFPGGWVAEPYDTWVIYQKHIKDCCCGLNAADFLAIDQENTLWIIEVKDYRIHRRGKIISLIDEMAIKVAHTLSGLVIAAKDSNHAQYQFARECVHVNRFRVVLHLEQPMKPSKLFPRQFMLADIQSKLKQLIKPIDAHPLVVEKDDLRYVGWNVR